MGLNKLPIIVLLAAVTLPTACSLDSDSPSQEISQTQPTRQSQPGTETRDLPPYKVLDTVDVVSGERYGDILVKTFSRDTPKEDRESALRRIAQKEGFQLAVLLCSEEAYQANISLAFLEGHPNALKSCFLGSLKDGVFTAGEELFP